jgi:hypothetical protein
VAGGVVAVDAGPESRPYKKYQPTPRMMTTATAIKMFRFVPDMTTALLFLLNERLPILRWNYVTRTVKRMPHRHCDK